MTDHADIKPVPWGKKHKKMQAMADAASDNRHFPCANCGADLRYHPGESNWFAPIAPRSKIYRILMTQRHMLNIHFWII